VCRVSNLVFGQGDVHLPGVVVVFKWRRLAGAIGVEDDGAFGVESNWSGILDGFNGLVVKSGMALLPYRVWTPKDSIDVAVQLEGSRCGESVPDRLHWLVHEHFALC
jgi:hypothetical protein